ncbi:helix-turn-helix domain-containing protein [Escherichia albertii]|uniref:helix-turn-helix domain-containing protein n=2 Tax=Escherichia albertii TaxID=208962 RepID=UPI003081FBF7
MATYGGQFTLTVVSEKYLEGELSLKSVARMYGISPCTVRKWAYAYREHGISIITGKKGRYFAELKRKRQRSTVLTLIYW